MTSPYGIGSEYSTSISYNPDNTRDTLTAQNGAVTTYTYDVNARPTHISTANTSMTVLQASSYYYDNAGNVMTKPIFGGGTGTPNVYYQYDGADELTMESMPTTSTDYPNAYFYRYAYDHNANRLNKETIVLGGSPSDTVAAYTYDSHDKMTASGPYTFTYDANGNMTGVSSGGTANWSYTYDCQNRMLVASDLAGAGSGGSDSNTYNGIGCRVANHDFAGNYSNMTDGVGPTSPVLYNGVEKFTPGFSSEDLTGSGTSYYTEPDQIGTSLGMMSTSETQIYGVEYDAFGDIIGTSGTFPDSYAFMDGYAGQGGYQTDRDTGFIRCGNRFYSPFFGRFITQDPVRSGTNWYAYCANDPTGETDPSGEKGGSSFFDGWNSVLNGMASASFAAIGAVAATSNSSQTSSQQGQSLTSAAAYGVMTGDPLWDSWSLPSSSPAAVANPPSDWNPFTWDFDFSIADCLSMDDTTMMWGKYELAIGGSGAVPFSSLGGFNPGWFVPGIPGYLPGVAGGGAITNNFTYAPVLRGVVTAFFAGIATGGIISMGISEGLGAWDNYVNNNMFNP